MAKTYSYACSDYPGMESCPGKVVAETEEEVMKLLELHAAIAHGEDPSQYSDDDRAYLKTLIKSA
jgi:predicted small metal-binding protein